MRAIDADALLKKEIQERRFVFAYKDFLNDELVVRTVYKDLSEFISDAPTLTIDDLRPKGRWDLDEKRRPHCTNCKKVAIQFENKAYYVPDFCYHCGADMRGGGEDA